MTRAPFGTVLGESMVGGQPVQVFSCHYGGMFKMMRAGNHYHQGTYTGYRFQCVELARRFLIVNYSLTFASVQMAHHIFDQIKHLDPVVQADTPKTSGESSKVPLQAHRNGKSAIAPHIGSLLIWEPQGYFKRTGHVAIVVDVQPQYWDIIEQNVEDRVWPPGRTYSRRLAVTQTGDDNSLHVQCTFSNSLIRGWLNFR